MVNNLDLKKLSISAIMLSIFVLFGTNSNALAVTNQSISLKTLDGYVDGMMVSYIVTDTSYNKTAASITESQGHRINFAPILASIPNQYLQQVMTFLMA